MREKKILVGVSHEIHRQINEIAKYGHHTTLTLAEACELAMVLLCSVEGKISDKAMALNYGVSPRVAMIFQRVLEDEAW